MVTIKDAVLGALAAYGTCSMRTIRNEVDIQQTEFSGVANSLEVHCETERAITSLVREGKAEITICGDDLVVEGSPCEEPQDDDYERGCYEAEQWDGVGRPGETPEPDAHLDMYPRM